MRRSCKAYGLRTTYGVVVARKAGTEQLVVGSGQWTVRFARPETRLGPSLTSASRIRRPRPPKGSSLLPSTIWSHQLRSIEYAQEYAEWRQKRGRYGTRTIEDRTRQADLLWKGSVKRLFRLPAFSLRAKATMLTLKLKFMRTRFFCWNCRGAFQGASPLLVKVIKGARSAWSASKNLCTVPPPSTTFSGALAFKQASQSPTLKPQSLVLNTRHTQH